MKKLLLTFIFGLILSLNSTAQSRKSYSDKSGFKVSHGVTLGGLIFTASGFLTPPLYSSKPNPNSTSSYNTTTYRLPFNQQGPRATCIVTGVTLTCTGLITMLAGK